MSEAGTETGSQTGSGEGALADDPTNDADGRGVEATSSEDGTTFEPEEDPEAVDVDD